MSDGAAEPSGKVERLARRPLEHLGGVVRGIVRALPQAIEDMFADRCTQYAAAIANRVLFSLFPLTIALVSIFGVVLQDDELRQKVIDEIADILPVSQSGQGNLQTSIEQIATPLSLIGLVSLVSQISPVSGCTVSPMALRMPSAKISGLYPLRPTNGLSAGVEPSSFSRRILPR